MKAAAVSFDGPQATLDRYTHEEIPVWTVCLIDDDGEPVGKVYTCYSYSKAESLARKIAHDRRVELVHEAMYA